jgi:hypothetical protein
MIIYKKEGTMKQRFILAVERKNLTEQAEIQLLNLDRTLFLSENSFKRILKDTLQEREGKVKVVIGTFAEWVRYARENVDFKPEDYTVIDIEIEY